MLNAKITLSPVEYLTVEFSTFKKTIITINLDPPQTSKQIYRKLKYREKVFGEFQRLPCFPRKCFKITNLADEYKTIFLGKRGKRWNSPKTFSLYLSFLQICFKVWEKPKSNLMSYGILVQDFKMPTLVDEYKTIFLGKRGKRWNSPKTFSL